MKISQLMQLLEKQKQTHGDVEVSLFGVHYSINELLPLNSWSPKTGDYIDIVKTN